MEGVNQVGTRAGLPSGSVQLFQSSGRVGDEVPQVGGVDAEEVEDVGVGDGELLDEVVHAGEPALATQRAEQAAAGDRHDPRGAHGPEVNGHPVGLAPLDGGQDTLA